MSPRLREEAAVLGLALQFMTRLPLPAAPAFAAARLAETPRWYPAVGAVIGGIGAIVLLAAARILPMPVAVILSLAATVVLTGALHEDGLADCFDGVGAATAERALEIMRDSRLGTYGALALGLTLALKVAALSAMQPGVAAAALVTAHAASRLSCVLVIATSRYVRPAGAGGFTGAGVGGPGLGFALAFTGLVLAAFAAIAGLAPMFGGLIGLALGHGLARAVFERRLGGYTGDCLGATQQLSEVGTYLGILAWL